MNNLIKNLFFPPFVNRLGRILYIKLHIFITTICIIIEFPIIYYATNAEGILRFLLFLIGTLVMILSMINLFRIMIRRLHDINLKGHWAVLSLAGLIGFPIVGFIFYITLLFFPGTNGANQFGNITTKVGVSDFIHILIGVFALSYTLTGYADYLNIVTDHKYKELLPYSKNYDT